MRWIRDEEFVRGSVPMTKFEVRTVTVAMLEIEKGDVLLDIGAGTGSVSIECALQGARVFAVERQEEGINLIRENASKFKADIEIVNASAPEGLYGITEFNKCFLGGSGGNIKEIFEYVNENMAEGGIITANFIMIKNLYEFLNLLERHSYKDIETKLVQVSYMDRIGLLKAHNPVFIVKGKKP